MFDVRDGVREVMFPKTLGFHYDHVAPMPLILVPYWAILFLLIFAIFYVHRRNRRRRTPGHPICLYDLTGNTSGTCPECGTVIPKASGPA
jgi:hypothetical protein